MTTSIANLQVREDFIVTIAGSIVGIREDEFLLQDSTGQIWVDPGFRGLRNLAVGQQVTVTGELDDLEDFDARQITQTNRPTTQPPTLGDMPNPSSPNPPLGHLRNVPRVDIGNLRVQEDVLVRITGTVARIRGDEFVLRDRTGRVRVERMGRRPDIAVGDRLSVVGEFDDEDFDALRIRRISRLNNRSQQSLERSQEQPGSSLRQLSDWEGQSTDSRSFLSSTNLISDTNFTIDSSII